MNDQFARIRDHFLAALQCDGTDAQLRYAEEHCSDCPTVQAELLKMLHAHQNTVGFLASRTDEDHSPLRLLEMGSTYSGNLPWRGCTSGFVCSRTAVKVSGILTSAPDVSPVLKISEVVTTAR